MMWKTNVSEENYTIYKKKHLTKLQLKLEIQREAMKNKT